MHDDLTWCASVLPDRKLLRATQLNYGDTLLRRNGDGDRDRAVALLNEALAFAREGGMSKVQADSERLLAVAGG